MRLVFLPQARAEFDDAVRRYAEQADGLGVRFRAEVTSGLRRIRT